ncbi:MAG: trigger factor [Clostridiales Family XIII bacterium]|jgi:trigger factor|nr:trigger factor [Clostridiales Family XIII bacterium]
MESTFIERVGNEVKFSVEFTADEFENAQIEVYKNNKKSFAVAGFRKGKVPRKLVELHYGEDIFFEDAVNELVARAYPETLNEFDIEPIDNPILDFSEIAKGAGFTMTATVATPPDVDVRDYKGVKIQSVDHAVSEKDVDREIETLQNRNTRLVIADRPAENGDTVLIDYKGFIDDNQFDGGSEDRHPLKLGAGLFIPGFEEQLLGVKPGEEKDVRVTFPETYHTEDLAGKEALFRCTVHEIKTEEKPEINDDFAQDVSEFDTLSDLRADLRRKLEESAHSRSEMEMKNAVIEKIYLANEIDIPDVMVERQMDELVDEFAQQLRYQGLSPEQYYEYSGKDEAAFRDGLRDDAFKRIKTRLLVRAVADAENFTADEDEIEKEIADMADMYKTESAKLRESMGDTGIKMIRDDIRNRKAVDFLFANAVIEPAAVENEVADQG